MKCVFASCGHAKAVGVFGWDRPKLMCVDHAHADNGFIASLSTFRWL